MKLGEAAAPAGMRLYAIGDVHGCLAKLEAVHRQIAADLARRPAADHRIVHLGDYVDRGPDSAGVVDLLSRLAAEDGRILCLRGNHEEMVLAFLDDPIGGGPTLLHNGGAETLTSYGVAPFVRGAAGLEGLRDRLAAAMPPRHLDFLRSLILTARFGDYFFCHAGIRPGVPLDRQAARDLVWIRGDFLRDGRDHGVVVIHGHTPVEEPEVRANRIDIDTGAVMGGPLTCLVLEGREHEFL